MIPKHENQYKFAMRQFDKAFHGVNSDSTASAARLPE
jgi:hypothetical protein